MMIKKSIKRVILPNAVDFKDFWKKEGPFKYALTSKDFPPVLMEPEEWIFSNNVQKLLKALMQFNERKMKFVKVLFNPENKKILRPENLSQWKISHFPEEWNPYLCDIFIPQGHLTRMVFEKIALPDAEIPQEQVENCFFCCLEIKIGQLGYLLLKPSGTSKYAAIARYLARWEEDDREAGLL